MARPPAHPRVGGSSLRCGAAVASRRVRRCS